MRQIFDLKHGFAQRDLLFGEDPVDGPSDHQADELSLCRLGDRTFADIFAVAQACPSVANSKDFVELVRDEKDRSSVLLQTLDNAKEILDFMCGECGGQFVHDHDAGVVRQRAGDLDQMLLRHAQAFHGGRGIEITL